MPSPGEAGLESPAPAWGCCGGIAVVGALETRADVALHSLGQWDGGIGWKVRLGGVGGLFQPQ